MSSDREKQVEEAVRAFAAEYWRDLTWQLGQMIPGADGLLPRDILAANVLERAMEAQEWLRMARYGAGLEDADPAEMHEICQSLAEWLFAIPGEGVYSIPDEWADSAMGALWWAAYIRCQGDELITLSEAAALAGVSVQAISQRIERGTLRGFTNPAAPARQGRTLVRRSDVA